MHWQKGDHGQSSLLVLSSCISVFLYFRNCKYFSLQSIYTRVKRAKKRPWSVLGACFCHAVFLYFCISVFLVEHSHLCKPTMVSPRCWFCHFVMLIERNAQCTDMRKTTSWMGTGVKLVQVKWRNSQSQRKPLSFWISLQDSSFPVSVNSNCTPVSVKSHWIYPSKMVNGHSLTMKFWLFLGYPGNLFQLRGANFATLGVLGRG